MYMTFIFSFSHRTSLFIGCTMSATNTQATTFVIGTDTLESGILVLIMD